MLNEDKLMEVKLGKQISSVLTSALYGLIVACAYLVVTGIFPGAVYVLAGVAVAAVFLFRKAYNIYVASYNIMQIDNLIKDLSDGTFLDEDGLSKYGDENDEQTGE